MSDSVKGIGTLGVLSGPALAALSGERSRRADSALQSLKDLAAASNGVREGARDKDPEEVKKAATQFEGLLLQQMMSSMWDTVHTKDTLLGSKDEETYRDMFNQALADSIAEGQGIGIKEVITKEIVKQR